jgi:nucleotide-binding universal stress UspA family protein
MENFSVDDKERRELRALLKLIKRENCVLVLGPRIAVSASRPGGATLEELLSTKLHCSLQNAPTERPSSLRAAAELHYKEFGRTQLEVEVEEFYSSEGETTTDFHRDLAKLPFRLCISASADNMMLTAFKGVPKQPQMDYYRFNLKKRGRKTDLVAPTVQKPIIYHLFGHHEEGASLVLREADIIDHLVQIIKGEPPIPDEVRSVLTDNNVSFLFLGFGFHNWYLRVLLKVLEVYGPGDRIAFEDDGFFDLPEGKHAIAFFSGDRERRIDFRHLHWDTFARQLRENYEEGLAASPAAAAPAPEPAANAPLAFLSYASEDVEVVDQLQQNLESSGVNVWKDKQSLRAGDRWNEVLLSVIRNKVDYVIVVQTLAMTSAVSGVFRREIEAALEKHADMGEFDGQRLRFLLPVTTGPYPLLSSLRGLHTIDISRSDGISPLVQSILDDWENRQKLKALQRSPV